MQYFNDMDDMYEHACEMESDIELAAAAEQYEEAAKLKKEYDELRKKDLVDALLTVSHSLMTVLLPNRLTTPCWILARGACKQPGGCLGLRGVAGAQELNTAVDEEDYGTAAELRDRGCAGLIGWWHSRTENDPCGHLLRFAPDFGRYTAVMYTPRDFAELKVLLCHFLEFVVPCKMPAARVPKSMPVSGSQPADL